MADRGIDAVSQLVESLWSRRAEIKTLEGLMKEICVYLGEESERQAAGELTPRDKALVDALRAVVLNTPDAPDVHVNVEAPTVNVAAPQVTVVVPEAKGWVGTVLTRDGNNQMKTFSLKPE